MRRLHASDEQISEAAQVSIEQVMRHFRVCVPILEDSAEDADAVSDRIPSCKNCWWTRTNFFCSHAGRPDERSGIRSGLSRSGRERTPPQGRVETKQG